MSLPRLRADVGDGRAVAKILRGALRHEVEVVPLSWPPSAPGQHLLEVEVEGEGVVTLLADPAGDATEQGHPLHVRPVTRPQMASLFALIERLDEEPWEGVPPSARTPADLSDDDSTTLVLQPLAAPSEEFGLFDTELPEPMPSARPGPRGSDSPGPSSSSSIVIPRVARPPSVPPGSVMTPAVPAAALIGRVIAGKYRIESAIGSGASAAVFRARHIDLQRDVAVKVLHEQKLGDAQFTKRFKGEALAASKLEHPNVARVLDFGQEPDGLLYLVMELLAGRSLEAILAASGAIPQRAAITFAIQAASALAFAHDVGIVHRDVKPENIMIVPHRDDDGNPCDLAKVCDFGLAKLREGASEEITTAGMLCGSPAYMSPEQTRGETLDGRSDIYSLGVTLFESLTGTLPHEAVDMVELFNKKMTEPARRLSSVLPGADALLEDILARTLAADPARRHPNARVLREELKEALALLEDDADEPERTIVAD